MAKYVIIATTDINHLRLIRTIAAGFDLLRVEREYLFVKWQGYAIISTERQSQSSKQAFTSEICNFQ